MANLIDLSVYKKEDTIIKSLNGTEYTIPGNFQTELLLKIYKTKKSVDKLKEEEFDRAFTIMKEWAIEILSLDKTKTVTMETIENEFNDFRVLEMLLTNIMQLANE